MSNAEREAILAETSTKTTVRSIPIEKLIVDKNRNVRGLFAYDMKNKKFKTLVESIQQVGFLDGNHITVHDEGNGTFLVLKGHRRVEACKLIPTIKSIPAIVLSGLSESAKNIIIVDHGGVAGLDKVEELEAIRRLIQAGLGRPSIAKRMGLGMTYVQQRMQLLELPPYIQEQWKLEQNGETTEIKTDTKTIAALHKAVVEDRNNGVYEVEQGPTFKEEMVKVKTGTNSITDREKKAFNGAAIKNLGNTTHALWLKKLFYVLAGEASDDLSVIIKNLEMAHEAFFKKPEPVVEVYEGKLPEEELVTNGKRER